MHKKRKIKEKNLLRETSEHFSLKPAIISSILALFKIGFSAQVSVKNPADYVQILESSISSGYYLFYLIIPLCQEVSPHIKTA
jgi:hypothetical protein